MTGVGVYKPLASIIVSTSLAANTSNALAQRGFGQRVGIHPDEQRACDPASAAMEADRLTDRQDMRFVETVVERRTPMTRRAESDALGCNRWIRFTGEIGRHQPGHINPAEIGQGACRHAGLADLPRYSPLLRQRYIG